MSICFCERIFIQVELVSVFQLERNQWHKQQVRAAAHHVSVMEELKSPSCQPVFSLHNPYLMYDAGFIRWYTSDPHKMSCRGCWIKLSLSLSTSCLSSALCVFIPLSNIRAFKVAGYITIFFIAFFSFSNYYFWAVGLLTINAFPSMHWAEYTLDTSPLWLHLLSPLFAWQPYNYDNIPQSQI